MINEYVQFKKRETFLFTLRSFSIISSILMSPFWETLLSILVSHSQSSLYFSLNTVHSFSFSLTCCLRRDSCKSTATYKNLSALHTINDCTVNYNKSKLMSKFSKGCIATDHCTLNDSFASSSECVLLSVSCVRILSTQHRM